MSNRVCFVVILAALMLAVFGSCVFAQVDAGIKGYGSIAMSYNRVGALDINVAKSGDVISGGFRYKEYSTDNRITDAGSIIYSQSISSLQVSEGYAVVKAVGYWNAALSDITVEARDLGQGNDWFRITAVPRGMLTVLYDASGYLIKDSGDIVIVGGTITAGYAKGDGVISLGRALGRFKLAAELTNAGVNGYVHYVEAVNTINTARGVVRIYLPAVQTMDITETTAVLSGRGTLNGRAAQITVKVIDSGQATGPIANADWFEITATPMTTDSVSAGYHAEGRVINGDIVVAGK